MQIHVSPQDGLPVYRQIFNQVKYLVASGVLSPGEELPPIRALAEQLLINPNTVARAYRELEHAASSSNAAPSARSSQMRPRLSPDGSSCECCGNESMRYWRTHATWAWVWAC